MAGLAALIVNLYMLYRNLYIDMHNIMYYQSTGCNMTCLNVLIMNLHIPKCPTVYISLKLANFKP